MKKASILILLILICCLGYGQTYPLQQNVGNTPTTKVKTNALEGKIIITAFTDTSAANSEGYLKNYDGAVIKTTTPINALWYRVLDSAKWVQILPTGGGTGGIRAWLDGGNYNVLADGQGNAVFGTLGKNGIKFTTQAIPRFILDSAGILSETGSTIGIGYDPSNGNRLTQYSGGGGGSGNYLDSFWRVSGIDSNYYRINGVTYSVKDSTGGGGTGWSLTGNSGTDPSTNFLGTTDAQDLVIKVDNAEVGRFGSIGNIALGGDVTAATGVTSFAASTGLSFGTGSNAFSGSTALGDNSNAFSGSYTYASGSTSMGIGVKSKSYNGVAVGTYNDSTNAASSTSYDPLNRAFQIGIGTDNANRANALTVLFNGNTGIGTVNPDSTLHVVGGFKLVNGTQGNGKVLTSDANGGASWQTAGGGTPSLTQYRLAVGDASNLLSSNAAITGGRALASDANGVPVASSTTATELGYVNGVTSSIQTQLNAKLSNITGLVTAGTNVTVTGSGTSGSPYVVSASTGGVTSFSKTDNWGIVSTVTNPNTTPNHAVGVDSSVVASKDYVDNKTGVTLDSTIVSTGGQTAFTFSSVPSDYKNYLIFVNGAEIEPVTYFTTSGNTITFTGALILNDRVRYRRIK